MSKIYVAYKPCIKPEVLVQWCKGQSFINVTKENGLGYFEDEVGYYYKSGELVCTAN